MKPLKRRLEDFEVWLSSVHPLKFLGIYVSLIPIFAVAYCLIGGFYAPYARLENAGEVDATAFSAILGQSLRRNVHERVGEPKSDQFTFAGHRFAYGKINVSNFSSEDGDRVAFEVEVSSYNRFRPSSIGTVLRIPVFSKSSWTTFGGTESEDFAAASFYLDRSIRRNGDDFSREELGFYEKFLSGRILIPWADYEKLSLFLKGIKGDPLALSNAGARMLYYSSIVITTVGFGDIVPITYFSRTLTAFEAVLGVGLAGLFLNSLAYRASRRGDRGM